MAEYNGIKLVVSDLDGTLLDPDGNIGSDSINALVRLKNAGIEFAIATGRPFFDVNKELRECEAIRFFITSNGANVIDRNGELSNSILLDNKTANKVYDIVKNRKMTVSVHSGGHSIVDAKKTNPEGFKEYGTSEYYQKYYTTLSVISDDFDGMIKTVDGVEMMSAYFKNVSDCEECLRSLQGIDGITVTSSSKGNIELTGEGVSKGNALKNLIDKLGVSASKVATVGDSGNDISMAKVAGLPLAMENASDELKAVCKRVICSNAENTAVFLSESFI